MFMNENRVLSDNIIALCFLCRFSRLCVAFCELAWSFMAKYLIKLVSFFLAVIYPNSFGLVFLKKQSSPQLCKNHKIGFSSKSFPKQKLSLKRQFSVACHGFSI